VKPVGTETSGGAWPDTAAAAEACLSSQYDRAAEAPVSVSQYSTIGIARGRSSGSAGLRREVDHDRTVPPGVHESHVVDQVWVRRERLIAPVQQLRPVQKLVCTLRRHPSSRWPKATLRWDWLTPRDASVPRL